jgi:hypothetical protein
MDGNSMGQRRVMQLRSCPTCKAIRIEIMNAVTVTGSRTLAAVLVSDNASPRCSI